MLQSIFVQFARFFTHQRGNISVLFSLSMVPLIAVAGSFLDFSKSHNIHNQMQDAADAAALAGAIANYADPAKRIAAAKSAFAANIADADFPLSVTPTVSFVDHQVVVKAATTVETDFLEIIDYDTFHVDVAAAAERRDGAPACVLALNRTTAKGISITGNNSQIEAIDCAVHSNASGSDSIHNVSNETSVAASFCANGGINGDNFYPIALQGCAQIDDPFDHMEAPNLGGCDFTNKKIQQGTHTLTPGVYCKGISISGGSVTFAPGIYTFRDGPFKVTGNAHIEGEHVLFHMDGRRAEIAFGSQVSADFTAMEDGNWAGFLFFQQSGSAYTSDSEMNGGSSIKMHGTVYLPHHRLKLSGDGNMGVTSDHMAFIADTFEFKGNGILRVSINTTEEGYPEQIFGRTEVGARLLY